MPEAVIIANPSSGRGKGWKLAGKVRLQLAASGLDAELCMTTGPGDATSIAAEAVAAGCRRIIISGGDGTINEVLSVMANSDAVLGIIPCGRGNDLAGVLKIPPQLHGIVSTLLTGREETIDIGKIGERYFSTVACLGFDAETACLVHNGSVPFSGSFAYIYAVLKTLRKFRSPKIRLEGDFGTYEGSVLLAAAGNTTTYGGGLKITPNALYNDGIFDVCVIQPISTLTLILVFSTLISGTHIKLPFVDIYRTTYLNVESAQPLWIFADGEPICQTPARIDIVRKAVKILCPRE